MAEPPVELPDPLLPGDSRELVANRTECFWLDVAVPAKVAPGEYRSRIEVYRERRSWSCLWC